MTGKLMTIGYSTDDTDRLIERLKVNDVHVLIDVRSSPRSKYKTEFNQNVIGLSLDKWQIDYKWAGRYLGGMNNIVTSAPEFQDKIVLIIQMLVAGKNVAMMCAEGDPAVCHRSNKLACHFVRRPEPIPVQHILMSGYTEAHDAAFEAKIKPKDFYWEFHEKGWGKPAEAYS